MHDERDALMGSEPVESNGEARSTRIAWMLRIGTLLGLAIVIGRVIQLQVAPSEKLEGFIAARQTSEKLNSVRGDLLDRRGRILATSRVGYRVIVDPVGLDLAMKKDPAAIDRVIVGLSGVIDMPVDQIAGRLIQRMVRNEEIRGSLASGSDASASKVVTGGLATLQGVESPKPTAKLSRYLPMGSVLDQEQTKKIRELKKAGKLPGVTLEHTPVREVAGGSLLGSVIGKIGIVEGESERIGVLGAEKMFDSMLRGIDGSLTYIRDAKGRPLWVQRGAWVDSDKGQDVRLSIDLELQRIVYEQLVRGVEQADAAGGRAIVLNPHTGEILAMTDVLREIPNLQTVEWWDPESELSRARMPEVKNQPRYKVLRDDPNRELEPALAYNRCLQDVYEPGSTFKPFAWTLAKTKGLLPDDEVLDIKEKSRRVEYANRWVTDVYTYPDLDNWDAVIKYSSNIGMYMATSRLEHQELRSMVKSLGFGKPTGIGLAGESSGIVTSEKNWSDFTQTSVGMGYEVAVTPIQMVRAFSVFARHGDMAGTLPQVRLTASGDPTKPGMTGDDIIVQRVFSSEAALRTIKPMGEVAKRMDASMARQYPDEPEPKYSMFGKSGTSQIAMVAPPGMKRPTGTKGYYEKQHHSSFIVAAPANDPQIVVLVVIDDIGPDRVAKNHHYGSWVAGPVVRRVVEEALPYLGVPSDLPTEMAVAVE